MHTLDEVLKRLEQQFDEIDKMIASINNDLTETRNAGEVLYTMHRMPYSEYRLDAIETAHRERGIQRTTDQIQTALDHLIEIDAIECRQTPKGANLYSVP